MDVISFRDLSTTAFYLHNILYILTISLKLIILYTNCFCLSVGENEVAMYGRHLLCLSRFGTRRALPELTKNVNSDFNHYDPRPQYYNYLKFQLSKYLAS